MNSEPYIKTHFEVTGQPLNQMDYAAYFSAQQQQPYQFLGLPPTPGHSHSAAPDEFRNESPPQNGFDFQTFDAYNQFSHGGVPEPPTPQSQTRTSNVANSHDGMEGVNGMDYGAGDGIGGVNGNGVRHGSNSGKDDEEDEENMTPAQSRRKAQNRAAQRAFRERKEKHVKELEAQVAALKASTNSITTENERLRLTLQKVSTENEILKATSHSSHRSTSSSPPDTTGPMQFSPTDFYTGVLKGHANKEPSHRVVRGEGGTRLLGAGATWDFILGSEEFRRGIVDVGRVSEELRGRAKCDGQGPVFEEGDVRKAIEISVASGSDELI